MVKVVCKQPQFKKKKEERKFQETFTLNPSVNRKIKMFFIIYFFTDKLKRMKNTEIKFM